MTNSQLAARKGSQTPRVSSYPSYSYSAGPDAIDLAGAAGLVLDPWQQLVLTHGLGEQRPGKWSAFEVACWVPRQNGKGAIIEARVLAGLFLFRERLILWSAHEYKTAQEGFLRIRELIRQAPEFDALVKRYWEGSGEQGIELVTGQRLRFVARSKGSGRGFSGDTVILDEAQELNLLQMKALLPTLSAKPNPQILYFGTPPEDPTAWCYGIKEDGEAGKDRMAYFDWGLDVHLDFTTEAGRAKLADRTLWYEANPALGIRLDEQFCEDELSRLKEGFAAERLGIWPPKAQAGAGVIPAELWQALANARAERPTDVAFAIHVNLARTHAAIGYAGRRADGLTQVGLVDYRPGTSWVVERAVELKKRWNPVAIGVDTRSESLLLDMEKAGITAPESPDEPKRGDLAVPTASEAAAAYGLFVDAARREQLRHLDEAPLNIALAGAGIRSLAGGSTWDHRSAVEISPLSAVTLANWAYETRAHLVVRDYDPLNNIF